MSGCSLPPVHFDICAVSHCPVASPNSFGVELDVVWGYKEIGNMQSQCPEVRFRDQATAVNVG